MTSGKLWPVLLGALGTLVVGVTAVILVSLHLQSSKAAALETQIAHCEDLNRLNQSYKLCANLDKCLFSVDDILRYSVAREDAQQNCPQLIESAPQRKAPPVTQDEDGRTGTETGADAVPQKL
jgi:hypothetical protein